MAGMDREAIITAQIEHVLGEIHRLETELGDGRLTVAGSKGQPMPNRLLAELRQHRWLLVRMLDGAAAAGDAPPPEDAVDALRREWEDTHTHG
jgi:hypothetical protein